MKIGSQRTLLLFCLLVSVDIAIGFSISKKTRVPQSHRVHTNGRPTVPTQCAWHGIHLFSSNKKHLSASERERRDEDNRRTSRKSDVVIGQTSAKRGEKDFAIDSKATEKEWLRQASHVEKQVFLATESGMDLLKSLRTEEADEKFDYVLELKPNAYLWQAGIAKFYLGNFSAAADIFCRNAKMFESRFGGPASEERIWRDACELKVRSQMNRNERLEFQEKGPNHSIFPTIPETLTIDDLLTRESRRVIKLARDLFSATIHGDQSAQIVARARMRSICGNEKGPPRIDQKMWKLTSWYYLGLYYDVVGQLKRSKECMKMAARLCPGGGNADDIIYALPLLHMSERDWFDGDPIEDNPLEGNSDESKFIPPPSVLPKVVNADPIIRESIIEGISAMSYSSLQMALRMRGIASVGNKELLQTKLFHSLMDDADPSSSYAL